VAKRKQIAKRDVRLHQNPVTHELEVTVLDDVQDAYEVCVRVIEGQMKKLSVAPKCERLARKLLARVTEMLPRSEAA
jgi:hypothetical protein